MQEEFPGCIHNHPDCFALLPGGRCWCLNDTDFGGRDCPFRKPAAEIPPEIMREKAKEEIRRV